MTCPSARSGGKGGGVLASSGRPSRAITTSLACNGVAWVVSGSVMRCGPPMLKLSTDVLLQPSLG